VRSLFSIPFLQAISLLDDLDKELNNYVMRVREWYGWHFPEMGKVVTDNLAYAKTIIKMRYRVNCSETDFSDILPEDIEEQVKELAEVSMGTDISEDDLENILALAEQVVDITGYRAQLFEYLKVEKQFQELFSNTEISEPNGRDCSQPDCSPR
jgi:nucleolar protein 58